MSSIRKRIFGEKQEKEVLGKRKQVFNERSSLGCLRLLVYGLIVLLVIVFAISLSFRFSETFRRKMVFMNDFNIEFRKNLSKPQDFGLKCVKTHQIVDKEGVRLGLWHILPLSSNCSVDSKTAFNDNKRVYLYLHGNGGARGGHHRRLLYQKLIETESHVLAFDYRGFGDSSPLKPTKDGLISDAFSVFKWLLSNEVNPNRVVVWGHSLGTSVAISLVTGLSESVLPSVLVIESGFTSIGDAVRVHPFSKVFRFLPFFETFVVKPLIESKETNFDSFSVIKNVKIPILFLHDTNDAIIPFSLGKKLFFESEKRQQRTQFVAFDDDFGHKYIVLAKDLAKILNDFIEK
ncbi:lysophosphatidylserine lipase ABHD12-like [Oppia nitens]|uniref:lysophosphatidylserine lipase ABHD12-like n=1 Tax=Oppia nitens TaxID=1686743 RepID=UPI0023DA9799|nr:lysophosphatidylserine lipase ABHD12-like [Oppia nitens]